MRLLAVSLLVAAMLGIAQRSWAQQAPRVSNVSPALVIAALQKPLDRSSPIVTTQLRPVTGSGAPQSLYRPIPSHGDSVAVGPDERKLAYTDQQFQLHLVTLANGRDHALGKGIWAQFSSSGRYLASIAGCIMSVISPGPRGHLTVDGLTAGRKTRVGPNNSLFSYFTWPPRPDRLGWQIHLLKGGSPQRRPDPKGHLWVGTASAAQP
jgi:hypothetical protein